MRVAVTVEVDTETGDYEMVCRNVSHPGDGIDWGIVSEMLRRIFVDVDKRADCPGDTQ